MTGCFFAAEAGCPLVPAFPHSRRTHRFVAEGSRLLLDSTRLLPVRRGRGERVHMGRRSLTGGGAIIAAAGKKL